MYQFERVVEDVKRKIKDGDVYHAPFDSIMGVPYRIKNGTTYITRSAIEHEGERKHTVDDMAPHWLWVYNTSKDEQRIERHIWMHKTTADIRLWGAIMQEEVRGDKPPKHINLK